MATLEELAKEVIASINSDADYLLAVKWANSRYREMVSRARFRHLRETDTIPIAAGGSTWDAPTDLRWFGTVVYDSDGSTLTRVVQRVTIEELDDWYPTRTTASGGPRVYAEKGLNAGATAKQIEVYPTCPVTAGAVLRLVYWEEPTALGLTDSFPFGMESHVIREGVLVDLFRLEMAKAIRNGSAEQAQLWGMKLKDQAESWEHSILEAVRSDRGEADDLMLIEQKARAGIQGAITSSAKYPSR